MIETNLRLQELITYAQSIVDTIRDPLLILNSDLRILSANHAFYRTFRVTVEETENELFTAVSDSIWNTPELFKLLKDTLTKRDAFDNFEAECDFPNVGRRVMLLNGRRLLRPDNHTTLLVLSIEDITARRESEAQLSLEQDQDKKIALALQRHMLFLPEDNAFSGLTVHTAYEMASDEALVGGDFWDTFAFNNEHVALVIGDVMGHGLTSAIFTTELKYAMRAYIREHVQPDLVLHHMNEYLCQSNRLFLEGINTQGSDTPVCLALAVIVRETGKGTLAVAGMEPPLLVRANGETEQTMAVGLPLGILTTENYQQVDFLLEEGDTLILSTDGITEARQGRQFLDTEGLTRLAVASNGGTLKAMADTILNGARDFAGGKLRDDATLVLVRRSSTFHRTEQNVAVRSDTNNCF